MEPQLLNGLPRDRKDNYSPEIIRERLRYLGGRAGVDLEALGSSTIDPELTRCNIERPIGFAQVPTGAAGPLLVKGKHAHGEFYVPMATTEGALILSYERGSRLLSKSGGARVAITKDAIQRAPLFVVADVNRAVELVRWCESHLSLLRGAAAQTTNHGQLLGFQSFIMGCTVALRLDFSTGDAMGMNMISKAAKAICECIASHLPVERYLLECNLAADKKPGFVNLLLGRGKSTTAEAVIPADLVRKFLHTSPEAIVEGYQLQALGNTQAGLIGSNYHMANGLAAVFLACGQDLANVAESCSGTTFFRMDGPDLYASVTLPSLVIGTVGGGTGLPTQRECLGILDCYGPGKALRFAEILTALILAGELSLAGSIAANDFVEAHEKYGRNGSNI